MTTTTTTNADLAKIAAPTPPRIDQQLDVNIMRVTPRMAEEWLGRNEANRNIRPGHVASLARDMTAGNFVLSGESIKFDIDGNLIDGQHRLSAVRDSGVTIETVVVRGLPATAKGLVDTGKKRSAGDAMRMYGVTSGHAALAATIRLVLGIHRGQVRRAGDKAPEATHSEIIDFYQAHAELLDYCVAFTSRHWSKISARPAALAASTFLAAKRLAEFTAFINSVGELEFGPDKCPRRTLYRRLLSLHTERHDASDEIYYILRAFLAHCNGEPLTQMKSATRSGRSIIPTVYGRGASR